MSVVAMYSCDKCNNIFHMTDKKKYIDHLKVHVQEKQIYKKSEKELNEFYASTDFEKFTLFDLIGFISSNFDMFLNAFKNTRIINLYKNKRESYSYIFQYEYRFSHNCSFTPTHIKFSDQLCFNNETVSGIVMGSKEFEITKGFFSKGKKRRRYVKLTENIYFTLSGSIDGDNAIVGLVLLANTEDMKSIIAKCKLRY